MGSIMLILSKKNCRRNRADSSGEHSIRRLRAFGVVTPAVATNHAVRVGHMPGKTMYNMEMPTRQFHKKSRTTFFPR